MADLNLDIHYFEHLKTKRLVARLGRGSDVLPLRLFCYTAKHYAKDGRLTSHTGEDIEAAVGWWGKRGECTRNLHEVRFLDMDGDTYVVHGWEERSGHLSAFAKRAKAAAQARWGIKNAGLDATALLGDAQASSSNAPTNLPTNLPTKKKGGVFPGFDQFWSAYPEGARKVNRKGCLAKWQSLDCESKSDVVLAGLRRWKSSGEWSKDGGKFICAPLVWLNQERWEAEVAPAEPAEDDWRQPVTQEVIDCYLGKGAE